MIYLIYVIDGVVFVKNNLQFMINERFISIKIFFRQCLKLHCRKIVFIDYFDKTTIASASTNAPLGKDATPTAARAGCGR